MSLPGAAKSLGLGDIRIDSALNEPLSAQIDIVGATREELIELTAKVANRDVFQHYGAERPAFLASATFKVGLDSRGRPVLKVKSAEPFTDPVVNFLVDLRWGNAELIREYSLLLDPPGFAPAPRLAATAAMSDPTAPARPDAVAPPRAATRTPRERAVASQEPPQNTAPLDAPAAGQRRVAAHDTLRAIVRHAGAHTEAQAARMMMAIFHANPHAFDGNINLLRSGALLTLPSAAEVEAIDEAGARRDVRAQMLSWRQAGHPAATSAPSATAQPASAGPTTTQSTTAHAAAPDAAATDALKSRVQSLEQALDEMNKQLATENARIQDLKQLATQSTAQAQAPAAAKAPAVAQTSALAQSPAGASPAAGDPAPAPVAAGAAPRRVTVEVMHAAPSPTPMPAAAPTPASTAKTLTWPVILAPVAIALGLLFAGLAYRRRRMRQALSEPFPTALHDALPAGLAETAEHPTIAEVPHVTKANDSTTAGRSGENPKLPVAPAVVAAASDEPLFTDETTQDMEIDAGALEEALERSYLDALAIDTLGIDASGKRVRALEASDDLTAADSGGLDTMAMDASAQPLGASLATTSPAPAALSSTSLDYNLLDLDATAEHVNAQHVHMPSGLNDHAVVQERRMNIVDVLKTAIDRDPNRRDLRMKLLETYYSAAATNRRAFLEVAKKLSRERELVTAEDWNKVVKMGREIAGDDILFADPKDDFANCA